MGGISLRARLFPALVGSGIFGLGFVNQAAACCAVSPAGIPVVNADQTVILLWDRERKTEHFIRRASFHSEGDSVGFLVPSPSRPHLDESGDSAFSYLKTLTERQDSKGIAPIGCAAEPQTASRGYVRVIEEKTVAGFDTVVLAADSGKALVEWLRDHGYAYTPEAAEWAQPYLDGGWYMSAMKISKPSGERASSSVAASALRISFQTDQPIFPYREPDSRRDAARLHVVDRLLRIYFIGESRYEGNFPQGRQWSGTVRWTRPLEASERSKLLSHLKLPAETGPRRFWLTEFEDHWPYGKAPGDLYFSPSSSQQTVARNSTGGFDPIFSLALGVMLVRPLFRRRKS